MTTAIDAVGAAIAALRRIKDPAARLEAIVAVQRAMSSGRDELRRITRDTILDLRADGRTWEEIAGILGVSKQRAFAMAAPDDEGATR